MASRFSYGFLVVNEIRNRWLWQQYFTSPGVDDRPLLIWHEKFGRTPAPFGDGAPQWIIAETAHRCEWGWLMEGQQNLLQRAVESHADYFVLLSDTTIPFTDRTLFEAYIASMGASFVPTNPATPGSIAERNIAERFGASEIR